MADEDRECTALGLPLTGNTSGIATPLEAFVVVKGLDTEGKVSYWTLATPDLTWVEVRGMLDWALQFVRSRWRPNAG